jgi:hypothetical protein
MKIKIEVNSFLFVCHILGESQKLSAVREMSHDTSEPQKITASVAAAVRSIRHVWGVKGGKTVAERRQEEMKGESEEGEGGGALLNGVFDEKESHDGFLAAREAFLRTMDNVSASLDAERHDEKDPEKAGEEESLEEEQRIVKVLLVSKDCLNA